MRWSRAWASCVSPMSISSANETQCLGRGGPGWDPRLQGCPATRLSHICSRLALPSGPSQRGREASRSGDRVGPGTCRPCWRPPEAALSSQAPVARGSCRLPDSWGAGTPGVQGRGGPSSQERRPGLLLPCWAVTPARRLLAATTWGGSAGAQASCPGGRGGGATVDGPRAASPTHLSLCGNISRPPRAPS